MFNCLSKVLPAPKKSGKAPVVDAPVEKQRPSKTDSLKESTAYKKRGNEFLAQGLLEEAAECYRQAIAFDPDHAEAYLNLGFVLHGQELYKEAETYLKQATHLNPRMEEAYYLLGTIAQEQGNLDSAVENFNKALEIKPDFEIVYRDLCQCLLQDGQNEAARHILEKGISVNPDSADFHFNLGNLFVSEQAPEKAITCYQKVLSIHPDDAEVLVLLGDIFKERGDLDLAVDCYHKALLLQPENIEAHNNMGAAFKKLGNLEEAMACYGKVLALQPDSDTVNNNLGVVYREMDRMDDAAACFQKALSINPDYALAHSNLGIVLHAQGKLDAAVESYRKALSINPDYAEAHNNLASALRAQGKLGDAIEHFQKAVSIKPPYATAHSNLGIALSEQGRLGESIQSYRQAISLSLGDAAVHSQLLYVLNFLSACTPVQYLAEARLYGSKVMAQAKPYTHWTVHPTGHAPQPLRVGLVSGDFNNHPVGFFLESILSHLNPSQIELVAYPTQQKEDDLTARIKPRFAAWKPIVCLSDEAAARQIHEDGIHILIDLAGHTAHNRLPVFAWKPAPVQVTWLGYWASTGVPAIDYLLADPVSVPESHRTHFTETVRYLPDTRLCFTPPEETGSKLAISPPPALQKGYITFGCFQNLTKVNDDVLALWGRIFNALPRARLRLQTKQLYYLGEREHLLQRLASVGIAPERVTLEGPVPREDYLAAHAEVDIILDTFPYPGGTTTCEALWMGVPTVTLAGDTLLGRQGASLLTCVGLEDWIAQDKEEYVALAVNATDVDRLAQLRASLRQRALASPLFDAPRFARSLEDALQGMWQQSQQVNPSGNHV